MTASRRTRFVPLCLLPLCLLLLCSHAQDTDNDGLTDADETSIHNTDPADPDSDDDSMQDGYEVSSGHDPLVAELEIDPDLDGYPNGWEQAHGTNGGDVTSKPQWAASQSGPGYFYRVDPTLTAETGYEKKTIAAALSASDNFGILEVEPGTYTGNITLLFSKRVMMLSTGGASVTKLVSSSGTTLNFSNSSSRVEGFTIQGSTGAVRVGNVDNAYLRNCLIVGATSAGIELAPSITGGPYYFYMQHCTAAGNGVGVKGQNYWDWPNRLIATNVIVSGNTTHDLDRYNSDGGHIPSYTFINSMVGVTRFNNPLSGGGNLRVDPNTDGSDPAVVAETGLTPNYHSVPDSPAINAGVAIAAKFLSSDYDGEERPVPEDAVPDMGVDEYRDVNGTNDGDGIPDWWEQANPGLTGDGDNDGASDAEEYVAGTDPADPDTDDDSMKDGYELAENYNPLVAELEIDPDLDGYPNGWENAHGTNGGEVASKPQWAASQSGPGFFYRVDPTLAAETSYEKKTVTAALSASGNFGIIAVEPGTYSGNLVLSSSKRVMMLSTNGAAVTKLVSSSGITLHFSNSSSYVEGFTIEGSTVAVRVGNVSNAYLRNCLVVGASFAGVELFPSITGGPYYFYMEHCTVTGNARGVKGQNYWDWPNQLFATNVIVSGNSVHDLDRYNSDGGHLPSYTFINSMVGVTRFSNPLSGGGNLRVDPTTDGTDPSVVADEGWTADFHLESDSPAINRGTILSAKVLSGDLDGDTRANIALDPPDMGVDEVTDADGDGLSDLWELTYFGDLSATPAGDPDSDTLTNQQEQDAGTDPTMSDTDGDGLDDPTELANGTDPLVKEEVGTLTVSHESDLYGQSFSLTITANDHPDAEIRYTLDGSDPDGSSALYSGSLTISGETLIRASAFKLSFVPTPIVERRFNVDASANFPLGNVGLWLRGDRGLQLDAFDRLTEWRDQSGQGNHLSQSNDVARPRAITSTINASATIEFDGADDYLIANPVQRFPSHEASIAIFVRSIDDGDDSVNDGIFSYATTDNANELLIDFQASDDRSGFHRRSNAVGQVATTEPRLSDVYDVITGTYAVSSGEMKLFRNGIEEGMAISNSGTAIPTNGALVLGVDQDSVGGGFAATEFHHCEIAEVIVYSRVLDATEIADLQTYFETSYGKTASRPVATPSEGLYQNQVEVTLASATPVPAIRYTLDGSDPDDSSTLFVAGTPIILTQTGDTILKGRTYKQGFNPSGTVTLTYTIDTAPPVVSNLQFDGNPLADDTVLRGPGAISVEATDLAGISRVEFIIDGQLLGSDSSGADGYTFPWTITGLIADGPHTVTLKAYDSFNTSTELTVTPDIQLAPPPPPVIQQPGDGTLTPATTLEIVGTSVDRSQINLYRNGTQIASGIAVDASGQFRASVALDQAANLFTAQAFYRHGELSSASLPATVTFDDTRPPAPIGVQTELRPNGRIRIGWVAPGGSGDIEGYDLYRATGPFEDLGQATKVNSSLITALSFTDTPPASQDYSYRVVAVDHAGNVSPISDQVNETPDTATPSAAIVTQALSDNHDPVTLAYGPGDVLVTVTTSEPLGATPFLLLTPSEVGATVIPLTLSLNASSSSSLPVYEATFTVDETTATGPATFRFTAYDLAGNQGTTVTSGGALTIDNAGPIVTELDAPGPVENAAGNPVTVTMHATFDEPVAEAPTFTYTTTTNSTPAAVTVAAGADASHWTLSLALSASDGTTPEVVTLHQASIDSLGNAGDAFDTDHSFEVYQGELPKPAIPTGLMAQSLPGGAIALSWQMADKATDYRLYRGNQSDGSDLALVVATTNNANTLTDSPVDGAYYYAVESIRTFAAASSYSGIGSELIVGVSDSIAPAAPTGMALTLTPQGMSLNASPVADASSYRIYRASASITAIEGLSPVVDDITTLPAVDPFPDAAQPDYALVAVDAAGNVSAPSNSERLNIDLLPVTTLSVLEEENSAPVLSWSANSGNIDGYRLAIGPAGHETVLNSETPLATTSYTDIDYQTGERRYVVTVVDGVGDTSLPRAITFQPVDLALVNPGFTLKRGFINRLTFRVTNPGSTAINKLQISVAESVTIPTPILTSQLSSLAPSQSADLDVVIPGSAGLEGEANLTVTIISTPNPGETILQVSDLTLPVEERALEISLRTDGLTRGSSAGTARFAFTNTSTETVEIVSARNGGALPSPDLRWVLRDTLGNVLAQVPITITTGENVFLLADGKTSVLRIPAGVTYTSSDLPVQTPSTATRDLYLYIEGDRLYYNHLQAGEAILEVPFENRLLTSVQETSYSAEITQAVVTERSAILTGSATFRVNGQAAPFVAVLIKVARGQAVHTYQVVTDAGGDFAFTYDLAPSDLGGEFEAWALHPDRTDRQEEVSFTITDLEVSPTRFELTAPRNYAQPLSLNVATAAGTNASNVTVIAVAVDQDSGQLPVGVQLVDTTTITSVASGGSATLNFSLLGDNSAPSSGRYVIRLVSDDGQGGQIIWDTVPIDYSLSAALPVMRPTPAFLDTGVNPGSDLTETISIKNIGYAELLDGEVELLIQDGGPAPDWAQLATAPQLGNIAVGESRDIQIHLAPDDGAAAGAHLLKLRLRGSNHIAFDTPIFVAVTESGEGNLRIQVVDPFSTSDGDGGFTTGVLGARVTATNEAVPTITQTRTIGSADTNGIASFQNLPAGRYYVRVTGPNHDAAQTRVWIRPGATTTETVSIRYNAVTIEWEVTETQITDTYEVNLNLTFETELPVANVIAEPPGVTIPNLALGEVFNGELLLINVGQVRADDLRFEIPAAEDGLALELLTSIPSQLEAGESVRLGYRIVGTTELLASTEHVSTERLFADVQSPFALYLQVDEAEQNSCVRVSSGSYHYQYTCPNELTYGDNRNVTFQTIYDCSATGTTQTTAAEVVSTIFASTASQQSYGGGGYTFSAAGGELKQAPCWPSVYRDIANILRQRCGLNNTPDAGILVADDCQSCRSGLTSDDSSSGQISNTSSWVDLINREYQDRLTDLDVPSRHGGVQLVRTYFGDQWHWAHQRKLEFGYDSDGTTLSTITRNRLIYQPAGSSYVQTGSRITPNGTGFDWVSSNGQWESYDEFGRIRSKGYDDFTSCTIHYADGSITSSPTALLDYVGREAISLNYSNGVLVSASSPITGQQISYIHQDQNLTRFIDVAGFVWDYGYDSEDRLISKSYPESSLESAPQGKLVTIEYATDGAIKRMSGMADGDRDYQFNYFAGNKTHYASVTSSNGRIVEYWYDRSGEQTRKQINGEVVESKVPGTGERLSVSQNKVISQTNADGGITRDEFNDFGGLIKRTLPDGGEWTYQYDPKLGLPTRKQTPRGDVTQVTYNDRGQPLTITQGLGSALERTMTYAYYGPADGIHRDGLLKSQTDARGQTTVYEYTTLSTAPVAAPPGMLARSYDALEPEIDSVFSYDRRGNKLSETDAEGRTASFEYDALNRITRATNSGAIATSYVYDKLLLAKTIRNPGDSERSERFSYDARHRRIATYRNGATDPWESYEYDSGGNIAAITNASGEVVYREFDTEGRITAVKSPYTKVNSGAPESLDYSVFGREYNAAGNIIRETAADGVVTEFAYNTTGRLILKREAVNHADETRVTEYDYNLGGDLIAVRYPASGPMDEDLVTNYIYDQLGRLIAQSGDRVFIGSFTYDENDNVITQTNARDAVTSYTYDRFNRVKTLTLPEVAGELSSTTTFYYDRVGNQTAVKDARDHWVHNYYDARNQLVHVSLPQTQELSGEWWLDADSLALSLEYNAFGEVTVERDHSEGETHYSYDDFGRLTKRELPAGWTTEYAYNSLHRPLSLAFRNEPDGETAFAVSFEYDHANSLLQRVMVGPDGRRYHQDYDAALRPSVSRMSAPTGANGSLGTVVSSVLSYDAHGRVEMETINATTDSDNRETQYTYNRFGQLTSTNALVDASDPENPVRQITSRVYDAKGLLRQVGGDGTYPMLYGYDAVGNRTSMQDGRGNVTTWQYDLRDRIVRKTLADETTTEYTYDALGNALSRTDARGVQTSYTYNKFNRPTLVEYPTGSPSADVSFTYDSFGRPTDMSDSTLGSTSWQYDSFGRVESVTQTSVGRRLDFSYDSDGQRNALKVYRLGGSSGPALERTISYGYDTIRRLAVLEDDILQAPVSYGYEKRNSQVASVTLPNATRIEKAYDSLGQLTRYQVTVPSVPTPINGHDHDYNRIGQRTAHNRDADGLDVAFNYDQRRQLTNVLTGEAEVEAYTYDDIGNWTSAVREGTSISFEIDPNVNQYTEVGGDSVSYDLAGNLLHHNNQVYTWNGENQLSTAIDSQTNRRSEYVYDGIGRRIERRNYDQATGGTLVDSTRFLYDGWNVLAEIAADGSIKRENAWGLDSQGSLQSSGGIGALLAARESSGDVYLYLYDGRGNVSEIINESNEVVASYTYDSYGGLTSSSGPYAGTNVYRFSTKPIETWVPGNYYYGYRFYRPELGRWLNQDPLGEQGGANLYAFLANDPVGDADYLGLLSLRNNIIADAIRGGAFSIENQLNAFAQAGRNMESMFHGAWKGLVALKDVPASLIQLGQMGVQLAASAEGRDLMSLLATSECARNLVGEFLGQQWDKFVDKLFTQDGFFEIYGGLAFEMLGSKGLSRLASSIRSVARAGDNMAEIGKATARINDDIVASAAKAAQVADADGLGTNKSPGIIDAPEGRGICFVAGTQVKTDQGFKNIEAINVGDRVWSKSAKTGEQGYKRVLALFKTKPVQLVHLTYRTLAQEARSLERGGRSDGDEEEDPDSSRGGASSTITGTATHPFWSVDRQGWIEMGDLKLGERLLLANDSDAVVESKKLEFAQPGEHFTTHNIEVAEWHTYYVAPQGEENPDAAMWVHNTGQLCPEGFAQAKAFSKAGKTKAEVKAILHAQASNSAPNKPPSFGTIEELAELGIEAKRIRPGTNGKVAIIGRDMDEIRKIRNTLADKGVEVEIFDSQIPRRSLRALRRASKAGDNAAALKKLDLFELNRHWASYVKENGFTVIDRGGDPLGGLGWSVFYALERSILFE